MLPRLCLAVGLVLLACSGLAREPEVPVIEHTPLRCVVKDRFLVVEALIRPVSQVTHARIYFTSSAGDPYYWVGMHAGEGERFQARLPRPRQKAGPMLYFLEVLSPGGVVQRTAEVKLDVVKDAAACQEPERVAPAAQGSDVEIHAMSAEARKPKGFAGVARVSATTAAALPAAGETPAAASAPTPALPGPAPASSAPAALATPRPPAPTPSASPGRVEYPLGPDDIVKVVVIGHDDLSQTLLVQSDGTVIFPLIGRLEVADLTPSQLERALGARLARGFIRDPQVSVSVQEYRSKTVMVTGEVARPGPYPLSGSLRIVEMLAKAGMAAGAGSEVQVLRPLDPTDRPLLPSEVAGAEGAEPTASLRADVIKVDLRAIQRGDLDANILLQPNDTLFVPPAAKFYVTGEARTPGAYTLTAGITVREAVILAGGFSDNASPGRTRVIREVEGQKREVKVKLDDAVLPGDIIVVKGKLF